MSASAIRRSTSSVIEALKSALETVLDEQGAPAFQKVATYDMQSFEQAARDLLLFQARIAVIIPDREEFPRIESGRRLIVRRKLSVVMLLADRRIGNRLAALYGDDSSAGAFGLMELVLPAITGQLLPNPAAVECVPESATPFLVQETNNTDPGRAAVALEVSLIGGRLEATLDQAPIL